MSQRCLSGLSLVLAVGVLVCVALGVSLPRGSETVSGIESRSPVLTADVVRPQVVSAEPVSGTRPSVDDGFYQTILQNNLFAPLGTVLNARPRPGTNLTLIATFTTGDPTLAAAIIKNTATDVQGTVVVGDVIGGYRVAEIHPKQILIAKDDGPAIWKFMNPSFLD